MNPSDDDPYTQALRLDLPQPSDEARLRSRLISAGVLAGAVVAPSAAAGATAAGGLGAKLASLPLALKVGASVALLGVATLPVLSRVRSARQADLAHAAVVSQPAPARLAPPSGRDALAKASLEATSHDAPSVTVPMAAPAAPAATTERAVAPAPRPLGNTPAAAPVSGQLPAVASFADATPAPLDEGSLRAETALMERALAALKRDDLLGARRALNEHRARFPNGHLGPERERAFERLLVEETERHATK